MQEWNSEHQIRAGRDGQTRRASPLTRVLLVTGDAPFSEWAARILRRCGLGVTIARTARGAESTLNRRTEPFDAVVTDLDLPDGSGLSVAARAHRAGIEALVSSRDVSAEDAIGAMRAGATDFLTAEMPEWEFAQRVAAACRRAGAPGPTGIDDRSLEAREDMHGKINPTGSVADEFAPLIRHELDIEALLRTTLEFVLTRSGPTNAAVFLPTTSGDYSLGAYVNYDNARETVDVLLDHLANSVAPRFEPVIGPVHLRNDEEREPYLGDDAEWLGKSEVIAGGCHHDGECLAIFMLFRDEGSGFAQTLGEQMQTIAELFAQQLAKVIRVHYRHVPKERWGAPGDPEDNSGEAEDWEGGMAA